MIKRIVMLHLAALAALPVFAQADFSSRALVLKPARYDLELRLDYEARRLFGTCRITVSNPSPEAAEHVPLLLYRLLHATAVRNEAGDPVAFTQRVVSFEDWEELQINYVEIQPQTPLAPGEERAITLDYEGFLFGYTETGMRYVQDRIDPAFTIIRPDSWGYPVVGYPAWKVNRVAGLPVFDYRVTVTVPDSIVVANGGALVDRHVADGLATYTYENVKPTWRIDVALAGYQVIQGGKNRVFFFPEDAAGAARVLEAVTKTLDLYTAWFGPLRASQGYTVIEIPDGWGSQADVTSIIQAAAAFKTAARTLEVYHEVSHLWHVDERDALPPRWNEGLATFLQYLTAEKLEGRPVLQDALAHVADGLRETLQTHPSYRTIPLVNFGKEEVTGLSYRLGLILFAVLYELVGEAQFNAIVGSFYQTYYAKGATTDDFVQHANQVATIDLTRFFDEWIYGTASWAYLERGMPVDAIARQYRSR